jgi:hypothetical protein
LSRILYPNISSVEKKGEDLPKFFNGR